MWLTLGSPATPPAAGVLPRPRCSFYSNTRTVKLVSLRNWQEGKHSAFGHPRFFRQAEKGIRSKGDLSTAPNASAQGDQQSSNTGLFLQCRSKISCPSTRSDRSGVRHRKGKRFVRDRWPCSLRRTRGAIALQSNDIYAPLVRKRIHASRGHNTPADSRNRGEIPGNQRGKTRGVAGVVCYRFAQQKRVRADTPHRHQRRRCFLRLRPRLPGSDPAWATSTVLQCASTGQLSTRRENPFSLFLFVGVVVASHQSAPPPRRPSTSEGSVWLGGGSCM